MHVFNDKVISLVLGAPGSGKSTLAAKIVKEANKKGVPAFCNWPVMGANEVDLKKVYDQDLGKSVLIIDEAGLEYNSRNTKAFGAKQYDWFATTRHRGTQIIIIVQSWKRIDIVLRELATEVVLCKKGWFGCSTFRRYVSAITLAEDGEGRAREFVELFDRISWNCFWRPNYYHMFDSFALARQYEPIEIEPYPVDLFPQRMPLGKRILSGAFGVKVRPPAACPHAGESEPFTEVSSLIGNEEEPAA